MKPICTGYTKGKKCKAQAVMAIVELGDYAPVCGVHETRAKFCGWKLGPLEPKTIKPKTP